MPRRLITLLLVLVLIAVTAMLVGGCLRRAAAPPTNGGVQTSGAVPSTAPAPDAIRIATLNAEFLFDGLDGEGQASFAWKGDPALARAHRDAVGEVIRTIDADVLMLQEVEHLGVLESMLAESLAGMGYRAYLVDGRDSFTGQDVGLLSRLPVDEVGRTDERVTVPGTRQPYGVSKNMWVRLDLGGVPTTLVGVHFLARPDDVSRRPQRETQAEVIRRLVVQEMEAGRAVAVLGDLNDFDADTPDRAGNTPITDVLGTVKRAGPGPDDDLRNVMAEVRQLDRYTSFWDRDRDEQIDEGELSAIDHVLLSPRLHRALSAVEYVHGYDPREVTDHFPIVVTLDLPEAAATP